MSSDEKEYPYEVPRPDNVISHPMRSMMDLPVEDVLRGTFNAELEEIVVVGVCKDGTPFLSSSMSDIPLAMFHLSRGQHTLNMIMDDMELGERPPNDRKPA